MIRTLALVVVVVVGKSVFDPCTNLTELQKLTILSKEIQVQAEAVEPMQNIVELKLP